MTLAFSWLPILSLLAIFFANTHLFQSAHAHVHCTNEVSYSNQAGNPVYLQYTEDNSSTISANPGFRYPCVTWNTSFPVKPNHYFVAAKITHSSPGGGLVIETTTDLYMGFPSVDHGLDDYEDNRILQSVISSANAAKVPYTATTMICRTQDMYTDTGMEFFFSISNSWTDQSGNIINDTVTTNQIEYVEVIGAELSVTKMDMMEINIKLERTALREARFVVSDLEYGKIYTLVVNATVSNQNGSITLCGPGCFTVDVSANCSKVPQSNLLISYTESQIKLRALDSSFVSVRLGFNNDQTFHTVYATHTDTEDDPSVTPAPNPPSSSDCFPASAQVTLADGRHISMSDLKVGDIVAVGNGKFSPVYFFSHNQPSKMHTTFIRIDTSNGKTFTLSQSHYIPVLRESKASPRLVSARKIKPGDLLFYNDANEAQDATIGATTLVSVVKVQHDVSKLGLYNPHTLNGNILVDGFIASSYTEHVHPKIADMLLAPLKVVYILLDLVKMIDVAPINAVRIHMMNVLQGGHKVDAFLDAWRLTMPKGSPYYN